MVVCFAVPACMQPQAQMKKLYDRSHVGHSELPNTTMYTTTKLTAAAQRTGIIIIAVSGNSTPVLRASLGDGRGQSGEWIFGISQARILGRGSKVVSDRSRAQAQRS